MSSTLFGQALTDSNAGNTTAISFGMEFSLSQDCTLGAFWWYSPSPADSLPDSCAIYTVTGQTQVSGTLLSSPSWSGAAGSGWVRAAYSSPPTLTAGTKYVAVLHGKGTAAGWYGRILNYWTSGAGSGGVTSGPITAPSSASASNGQDPTLNSASISYPTAAGTGSNFLIDIEVSLAGTPGNAALSGLGTLAAGNVFSPSAALSGFGTLAAAGVVQFNPSAALSGLGTLAAAGVVQFNPSAALSGLGTLSLTRNLSSAVLASAAADDRLAYSVAADDRLAYSVAAVD